MCTAPMYHSFLHPQGDDILVHCQSTLMAFERRHPIPPTLWSRATFKNDGPSITVEAVDSRLIVRKRSVLSLSVHTELFFYIIMDRLNMDMLLMAQLPHLFDIHLHAEASPPVVDIYIENIPISFFDMFDPPPSSLVVRRRFRQLVKIVGHLHTHRIYHRDIKPHNIRFRSDGTLVLIDFNSCAFGTNQQTDFPIGTISYRPPELLLPDEEEGVVYDADKVDIFGVGMTLVAMVNQCQPLLRCHENSNPVHVQRETVFHIEDKLTHTGLPAKLGTLYTICMAMLSVKPSSRPSLQDVLMAVDAIHEI